jgi:hypothetical protein
MAGAGDRYNYSKGARTFGRFMVHPDKILVRVYPIKGELEFDDGTKLWIPPSAQRRESQGRWAKILQVGTRIQEMYPNMYNTGDIVICHKYVDATYGKEGKFRMGGKLVAVTMPSEILLCIEFDEGDKIPNFIKNDGISKDPVIN